MQYGFYPRSSLLNVKSKGVPDPVTKKVPDLTYDAEFIPKWHSTS